MNIQDWLLSPESRSLSFEALLQGLGDKLCQQGIPLWRISTSLRTFHPEVFVKNFQWRRDSGIESNLQPRQLMDSPTYRESPVFQLFQFEQDEFRIPLNQEPDLLPYAICRQLAAEGGCDYYVMALDYQDDQRSFISFTTDDPGGFSDADLQVLQSLNSALSLRNALAAQVFVTDCLLRVYLGHHAAQKVLGGQFLRGQSDSLQAVIWFSDMREFTALSTRVSSQRLLEILDQVFDAQVAPIHSHGGEVLKFIGDAILAIFPIEDNATNACQQALQAAELALKAIKALVVPESPELSIGIGLHLGEVIYGNIGATGRLDFTVMGAHVNEASRIEGLCKFLGQSLIMSEAFVQSCGRSDLQDLGRHPLRGLQDTVRVYGL